MKLLEKIWSAGVVGAGGAGFPSHIKLNCRVEYLILNGAECEPLLKTDQYLMREKAFEIVRAAMEIGTLVGAEKKVIGLKKKYAEEIKSLEGAIRELKCDIKLHLMDSFYPAGDEQMLVYEVTGRSIPPGGIPLDVGAVVSNVGTAFNIYEAMEDRPVADKYITVIGEVKSPTLLRVPIGTSVMKCIEEAGGVTIRDYSVIMGGPMMGKIIDSDDAPKRVIKKTDGAIIVIPRGHYIETRASLSMEHIKNQTRSACIQCTYCTELCPRYLIGHPLRPHKIMRSLSLSDYNEEIVKEALLCCECGICELYACPMGLSPRLVNIYFKNQLRQKGIKYVHSGEKVSGSDMREYRKTPTKRLVSRINIHKYEGQRVGKLKEVNLDEVSIPLRQHIGMAAKAVVEAGDMVRRGQIIGRVDMDKVGANVHASIDGRVIEVSDRIVIRLEDCGVIK